MNEQQSIKPLSTDELFKKFMTEKVTSFKVENNVRSSGDESFILGRYSNSVLLDDIAFITYKKKVYGKSPITA